MEKETLLIRKYIYDKYHKTYDDLFDAKINVNYTTYPLRDKYLYESLKSLQKQTVKPDNIFLWLSEDEYDKQIEQCYEEYELQNDVEALIEECSWQESFLCMQIQRIAREAKEKNISYALILKFFKEYDIQPNERVWFWMEYYFNN